MRFLLKITRSFRKIRKQNCCCCVSMSSLWMRMDGQQLITLLWSVYGCIHYAALFFFFFNLVVNLIGSLALSCWRSLPRPFLFQNALRDHECFSRTPFPLPLQSILGRDGLALLGNWVRVLPEHRLRGLAPCLQHGGLERICACAPRCKDRCNYEGLCSAIPGQGLVLRDMHWPSVGESRGDLCKGMADWGPTSLYVMMADKALWVDVISFMTPTK